jgi:GNAT superfamily N-acetyltransferase
VELVVDRVPTSASYPLRQAVLRPHQDLEAVVWEGDDEPDTATFAAFEPEGGAIVGVATVFPEAAPFAPDAVGLDASYGMENRAWRLRGMATAEGLRNQGIGSMVLKAVSDHVASRGGRLLWCNARVGAVAFYEQAGFATFGDEWVLASIGPHIVMWRRVDQEETR